MQPRLHPLSLNPSTIAIGLAICVSLIVVFRFSPRIWTWEQLEPPGMHFEHHPEIHRACDVQLQLIDPFAEIENESNRAIEWRFFIPLVGKLLHLPLPLFFGIAHAATILALAYLILVLSKRIHQWRLAVGFSLIFATSGWFFVSTAWLSYFDSVAVCCILILIFSKSTTLLVLCTGIGSLVDERFLIVIPLAIIVRLILQYWDSTTKQLSRKSIHQLYWVALIIGLYCLVRVGITLTKEESFWAYRGSSFNWQEILSQEYLLKSFNALIHGNRALLLLLPSSIYAVYKLKLEPWKRGIILTIVVVTGVILATIAGDLSRSLSFLFPLFILGFLQSWRISPKATQAICWFGTFLSLSLPAEHKIRSFSHPIHSFPYEWNQRTDYLRTIELEKHRIQETWTHLHDQPEASLVVLNQITETNYFLPDAWLGKAIIYIEIGDITAARNSFSVATKVADSKWEKLAIAQQIAPSLLQLNYDKSKHTLHK